MADGMLEKLEVHAHKAPDCTDAAFDTWKAWVNPNEVTLSYEMEYDRVQAAGTIGSRMDFKKMKPADLTLSFFLDGTGASGRPLDVQKEIERFQQVTGYNGEIHRTNYLVIVWGKHAVKRCVLRSASVTYKMWTPNGVPLRAVINAVFTEATDDASRIVKQRDQSADLTHTRLVRAGDSLPALCTEIYGDPRHYLAVAEANRLDDFRHLSPGMKLVFPPLEK